MIERQENMSISIGLMILPKLPPPEPFSSFEPLIQKLESGKYIKIKNKKIKIKNKKSRNIPGLTWLLDGILSVISIG